MIGLPLRLLAREVYRRVVDKVGAAQRRAGHRRGEDRAGPAALLGLHRRGDAARYRRSPSSPSTRSSSPPISSAATSSPTGCCTRAAASETLLLGAATMRPLIEQLLPGVTWSPGRACRKLTYRRRRRSSPACRARSAIVAFSADEVYAIAELIRRQRGGAAVVLGALSPRTRNAQVALYQSGDVDYLVATDAIGMGLNLDVDHVAFAADRKFDGFQFRQLTAAELGQIAGRAGRHMRDGTFGVTGRGRAVRRRAGRATREPQLRAGARAAMAQSATSTSASLDALRDSLADAAARARPRARARSPTTSRRSSIVARDDDIARLAATPRARSSGCGRSARCPTTARSRRRSMPIWSATLYRFLMRDGRVPDDWFAAQVAVADRTDGDIDTLSNRIAQIRTWTFVANRPTGWPIPTHWQERRAQIEDRLSDALHERLTQRFVDRRTSVLMRRLRENAMLEAEITADRRRHSSRATMSATLQGFRFAPDPQRRRRRRQGACATRRRRRSPARSRRAPSASRPRPTMRLRARAPTARCAGSATPVAQLDGRRRSCSKPRLLLLADEQLTGPARDKVAGAGSSAWLKAHVETLLKPLLELEKRRAADRASRRGIAFQLVEDLGVLERARGRRGGEGARPGRRARRCASSACASAPTTSIVPALLKPAPRDARRAALGAEERRARAAGPRRDRRISPRPAAPRSWSIRPSPRASTAPPASASAAGAPCASTSWSGSPT